MPYQQYARSLSAILVLLLLYFFLDADPAGWMITLGGILCCLVLAAAIINAWFLTQEYRKGELYLLNAPSLYVGLFSLLAFPVLLLGRMETTNWLFFYVLLFYHFTENIFRVRMDDVSLTVHTGFGNKREVPLFSIHSIILEEDFIEARADGGQLFRLEKRRFFVGSWQRLKRDLAALAEVKG